MERIPTDSYRELAQINLETRERRSVLDGDEPFDTRTGPVGWILTSGDSNEGMAADDERDSTVVLLVPTTDLDSDELFTVRLDFYYRSAGLAVLLGCPEALPRSVLDVMIERIELVLCEADLDSEHHLDLAWDAEGIGLRVLRDRTRRIEQSVRDALADDHLTDADYRALRTYPERLARVERLAATMADSEPEKRSFEIKALYSAETIRIAHFHQWVQEDADDARNAVTRLSGLLSSQQIVLTQRQAADTARFQRIVTIVGAAVLVPGLVAAIFGANVGFRGRDSTEAFWAMLILMAGSGIASFAVIRSFETDLWTDLAQRRVFVWIGHTVTDKVRVLVWALVAILALGAGIGLLLTSESQRPLRVRLVVQASSRPGREPKGPVPKPATAAGAATCTEAASLVTTEAELARHWRTCFGPPDGQEEPSGPRDKSREAAAVRCPAQRYPAAASGDDVARRSASAISARSGR